MLNLEWDCSDHRPIKLCLEDLVRVSSGRRFTGFKFNAQWVRHDECRQIICDNGNWIGNDDHVGSLQKSLASISVKLGRWGRKANCAFKYEICKKRQAIMDAYSRQLIDFSLIHGLEGELNCLLEEEEIYWHQRSRENWLKWGDKNTRWFHYRASERKRRNYISGIYNGDGN